MKIKRILSRFIPHLDDVNRLIRVLDQLVQRGASVIVIDHNRALLDASDVSIVMGPEGGKKRWRNYEYKIRLVLLQ